MKIDWPTLKSKRDKYIQRLNGIYERSASQRPTSSSHLLTSRNSTDVEKDNVAFFTGRARFVDANTISVSPTYLKATGG